MGRKEFRCLQERSESTFSKWHSLDINIQDFSPDTIEAGDPRHHFFTSETQPSWRPRLLNGVPTSSRKCSTLDLRRLQRNDHLSHPWRTSIYLISRTADMSCIIPAYSACSFDEDSIALYHKQVQLNSSVYSIQKRRVETFTIIVEMTGSR